MGIGKEMIIVWRKNHSESVERTIPIAHTGLGTVLVLTTQSGKTALAVGKISPRLNATLVLTNKT